MLIKRLLWARPYAPESDMCPALRKLGGKTKQAYMTGATSEVELSFLSTYQKSNHTAKV